MKMKNWLKPLALAVSLTSGAAFASPDFQADRSIFDGSGGSINPTLHFATAESGDLYLATMAGGELLFLTADGGLTAESLPFMAGQTYEGEIVLPSFDTTGIPAGRYPLYQLLVVEGGDVYNFNDWVGGFGALNQLHFSVGLPAEVTLDHDGDGWADDDLDRDGYHDNDHDRDGYRDDDRDRDGYHDDDHDRDGYHDDDLDRDGYHDDDHDRDGYHDDDLDRDGYHDDDHDRDGYSDDDSYGEGYDDDGEGHDGYADDDDDDRYEDDDRD